MVTDLPSPCQLLLYKGWLFLWQMNRRNISTNFCQFSDKKNFAPSGGNSESRDYALNLTYPEETQSQEESSALLGPFSSQHKFKCLQFNGRRADTSAIEALCQDILSKTVPEVEMNHSPAHYPVKASPWRKKKAADTQT